MDRRILLVLLGYAVITLVLFLPLVLNISTSTLAPNLGQANVVLPNRDRYHFIWNWWWEGKALFSGQSVLSTPLMFYPSGASLVLQTIDFVDGAIASLIATVTGYVVAYNIIILLSTILSGFAAFLLARHLTKDLTGSWFASFGAGLIFAYFPQHFSEATFGHPNVSSVEWLPLYLLGLLLTYEKREYRYAIFTGVMMALLTLTDLQLLLMGAVITFLYLIYHLISTRFSNLIKFLLLTGVIAAVGLALSSPYLIPAFQAVATSQRSAPPILQAVVNAAKPAFYITPPPTSYLYGNLFAPFYSAGFSPYLGVVHGGVSQWEIFIGFSALALAAIGLSTSRDPRRLFLAVVAGIAFIISLGPSSDPSQLSIQTPYTWLYNNFKILDYLRAEARFSILIMLALALLAAFGISSVMKIASSDRPGLRSHAPKILGVILLALILLEFAPVVTTGSVFTDPAYNIIARDNSNFAVLELPVAITTAQIGLFEQTIYNRPMVDGKISQVSTVVPPYMYSQLFLRILAHPTIVSVTQAALHRLDQPYNETQLAPIILTYYGIKYIVVHTSQLRPDQLNIDVQTLNAGLGPPVYRDSQVILYELPHWVSMNSIMQTAQAGPIVLFGQGWGPEALAHRVVTNPAQLIVFVSNSSSYTFEMKTSSSPICIQNANLTSTFDCGTFDPVTSLQTDSLWLSAGENVINVQMHAGTGNVSYIKVS